MSILQEKFQVIAPEPSPEDHGWVSDASVLHGNATPERLNQLPPGTDIGDQHLADIRRPMRVMSGETDVSADWNREAVGDGYKRLPMSPTEDAYTAEHVSPFYYDAKVDGEEGFAERNNMLDRE